jgi:VIT1/CCC1 family predicted Fe2+/Mn2+ transporter
MTRKKKHPQHIREKQTVAEQGDGQQLPSRQENIRTFIYYLISALLPIIFISIWASMLENGTVTLEGDDPYTIWIYLVFSILIYLNYLSVRKLRNRIAHFIIGVVLPVAAFLLMRMVMLPAIFTM